MRYAICSLLAIASLVHAQDGDGDGVIDRRDRCRFTPAGAPVDPAGCSSVCDAQTAGGDAFGRTILTEIGVSSRGTFGTNTAAPEGYHPRSAMGGGPFLGFVANPERNDWTSYDGDFFLPGGPEEGFGITVGDISRNNNNVAQLAEIAGAIVSATCVPSGLCGARGGARVLWRGMDPSGLTVEQEAVILDEGVFILLNIALTNTSGADLSDVYYLRNVDPDNNQTIYGNYTTRNTIVSQLPPLGTGIQAYVSAEQDTMLDPTYLNDSYVALASRHPSAVVTHGGFSNRSALATYTGVFPQLTAVGMPVNDDEAISIAFHFPTIGARETVRFTYLYVLGESAVDDALLCAAEDSDFDTAADAADLDDDNDGVADAQEVSGFTADPGDDSDGDGVPDWRDPDHVPGGCTDAASPRGVCDRPPAGIDLDGDGIPNHLDLDSDGDGLTDASESVGIDHDADGRPDACMSFGADGACRDAAGAVLLISALVNSDSSGESDLRDTDSDDDGLDDRIESHDDDGDGAIDLAASGADRDGDGIDDAYDIDCAGMPDGCAVAGRGVLVPLTMGEDADGDGLGDWLETCGDGYVRGGEICDTGALRDTCSASCRRLAAQPCVDDMECDTTTCNGTTMTCAPCEEAGAIDTGCTAKLPVCVTAGGTPMCEACEDNAPGGQIDDGCNAALPFCDESRTCAVCPEAACPTPDGGTDGGTDAGMPDAGPPPDAGVRMDGAIGDASIPPSRAFGSGFSCSASARSGGALVRWLLVPLFFVLRRRRSHCGA